MPLVVSVDFIKKKIGVSAIYYYAVRQHYLVPSVVSVDLNFFFYEKNVLTIFFALTKKFCECIVLLYSGVCLYDRCAMFKALSFAE